MIGGTVTISYAITVCSEIAEIRNLLDRLLPHCRPQDEVVVLQDLTAAEDPNVVAVMEYIKQVALSDDRVKYYKGLLRNNFSEFKNTLKGKCTKSHIFFLDADEFPSSTFVEALPLILERNSGVDLFLIPRSNTVAGITEKHLRDWHWLLDSSNRINYPDLQSRIIRNIPELVWEGRVHEKIVGYKTLTTLPVDIEWVAIRHPKSIEKQEFQNNYYNSLIGL
jgi:hypothetical protein